MKSWLNFKKINENNTDVTQLNDVEWTFDEYSAKQMECDPNTNHTVYMNNENEASIGIYCYEGEWLAHLEDPYGKFTQVIEISSFEEGIEKLKNMFGINNIEYISGDDKVLMVSSVKTIKD